MDEILKFSYFKIGCMKNLYKKRVKLKKLLLRKSAVQSAVPIELSDD